MATYVVWETEYPEEGSTEVEAESVEEAKQAYRDLTHCDADVELDADLMTPEVRAVREAETEDDLRRVIGLYGKALRVAREKGEHYPVCGMPPREVLNDRALHATWLQEKTEACSTPHGRREWWAKHCTCWKGEMEKVFG